MISEGRPTYIYTAEFYRGRKVTATKIYDKSITQDIEREVTNYGRLIKATKAIIRDADYTIIMRIRFQYEKKR